MTLLYVGIGLLVLLLFLGAWIVWPRSWPDSEEAEMAYWEKVRIAERGDEAGEELKRAFTLSSTAARVGACRRAREILEEIRETPNYDQAVQGLEQGIEKIHAVELVIPALGPIDRANRHRFKGKVAAEKDALLDALYELESAEATDHQIALARDLFEKMGDLGESSRILEWMDRDAIRERLAELGWTQEGT